MKYLLVPHNDVVRHKVLQTLNIKTNGQKYSSQSKDWWMPVDELISLSGVSDKDYRTANALLWGNKDIFVDEINGKECVKIAANGMTALNDKKYLKDGRSFIIARIKDYFSITAFFITLIVAIASVSVAINSLTTNKTQIRDLQEQVNELTNKMQLLTDTSKHH
jgi:hypothetical protein